MSTLRTPWLLPLALSGCEPAESEGDTDKSPDGPGDSGDTGLVQPTDWCEALAPGPGGSDTFAADLAVAQSDYRLFSPGGDWLEADAALVAAVAGDDPWASATLHAYADALPETCVLTAANAELGAASLSVTGSVAVAVPGTGEIVLPEEVETLIVDLRDLPSHPDTEAAVRSAAGLALAAPVPIGKEKRRIYNGFPTQWSSNVYSTGNDKAADEIVATGSRELPLVFLTGPRTAPGAAVVAGGLRVANRASIWGYDLFSAVAESHWAGVGDEGLAFRAAIRLDEGGDPWPDRIPADVASAEVDPAVIAAEAPAEVVALSGAADRASYSSIELVVDDAHPLASDHATYRAALLVMHGLFQRFWPYFEVMDTDSSAALSAALAEVEALAEDDRVGFLYVIGHYVNAHPDGHAFFGEYSGERSVVGYVDVQWQQVDGAIVVRTSGDPGLEAGDTVIAVGDQDAATWLEEAMARHSAASQGYLFDIATRELTSVYDASRTLTVRGVDGTERTVTPTPVADYDSLTTPWGGTLRASGWLDDLGAPTVYYLNLNGVVATDTAAVTEVFTGVLPGSDVTGLVVDMRDYPSVNHYTVAYYLNIDTFLSPVFDYPTWTGPDAFSWVSTQYELDPMAQAYEGPIAWMVSNKTVSAAENFSQMVVSQDRVTVVGQQSASTNGNITGAWLPGQYYVYWTGMRLLNPDGSQFHGVGIVPDVVVEPTAEDFAAGLDPELEAAVAALTDADP